MSAVVRIPLNFSDTPTTACYKYCSSFLLLDSRASYYMVHKEKLALYGLCVDSDVIFWSLSQVSKRC
jgi:hypothetical protein